MFRPCRHITAAIVESAIQNGGNGRWQHGIAPLDGVCRNCLGLSSASVTCGKPHDVDRIVKTSPWIAGICFGPDTAATHIGVQRLWLGSEFLERLLGCQPKHFVLFTLIICIKIDVNQSKLDPVARKGENTMKNGLEDVIAAETQLSDVDGEAGRLIIRGVSLDHLVSTATYESVAALLLDGLTERHFGPAELGDWLGEMRVRIFAHVAALQSDLLALPPVDAMRALIARLPDGEDFEAALRLLAAPAVFLPAILRLQAGNEPVAPDASLPQAADILRMLTGRMPSAEQKAALDAYLVTISDHGLNASTFASRVIASTRAGLTSSVLAAISALKGPLHGGAPGPVLDMFDEIGASENARGWLGGALDRGERLMGFGHRIYRVRDPRADALKKALRPLVLAGQVDRQRVELSEAVERAALAVLRERKPDRPLDVNVEFYTALLLDALGFPRESFTGVFAIGRTVGWIAHAREQALEGRLIRPRSIYVGPVPQAA